MPAAITVAAAAAAAVGAVYAVGGLVNLLTWGVQKLFKPSQPKVTIEFYPGTFDTIFGVDPVSAARTSDGLSIKSTTSMSALGEPTVTSFGIDDDINYPSPLAAQSGLTSDLVGATDVNSVDQGIVLESSI